MKYDHELWNKYTKENQSRRQQELSNFIYHVCLSLGAKKILEAGCNVGNNLTAFPKDWNIYGIDLSEAALEKARSTYQSFTFSKSSLLSIPYKDSFFDLVFTRGVLIHISQENLEAVTKELLRVSKKWVFNLEYFGSDGEMIKWKRGDDLLWYRDMKIWWNKTDAQIVSEVDIPLEIDSGKTRFTLVRKNI